MLKLYESLCDLHFGKLMRVYTESNEENAENFYPDDHRSIGILKAEQDFYQYLKESFFAQNGAFYAVWLEADKYVSALRIEPYRDGLLLAALETDPEHRGRGFAKKLILAVLLHLQERGCTTVYSHVGKKNTPSLRAHLACGFQRIEERAVYIDGSVTQRACTMCRKLGRKMRT